MPAAHHFAACHRAVVVLAVAKVADLDQGPRQAWDDLQGQQEAQLTRVSPNPMRIPCAAHINQRATQALLCCE